MGLKAKRAATTWPHPRVLLLTHGESYARGTEGWPMVKVRDELGTTLGSYTGVGSDVEGEAIGLALSRLLADELVTLGEDRACVVVRSGVRQDYQARGDRLYALTFRTGPRGDRATIEGDRGIAAIEEILAALGLSYGWGWYRWGTVQRRVSLLLWKP